MLRALLYSLLTAAVALPLGYFVEPWMGWVLFYIGLSVHLGFHYRNFSRLQRWSRKPFLDASLEGDGEWDDVFRRLYSHEKEMLAKIEQRERDIARLIAAGVIAPYEESAPKLIAPTEHPLEAPSLPRRVARQNEE